MVRIVFVLVALMALAHTAVAQEPRVAVGGSMNFVTQTRSDDQPLGGTTLGGSALFGVRISPRVSIEFEPSFGGSYSWEYTYRPFPSAIATVVASRRDMFFPVQARIRLRVLEPVFGAAAVHSHIDRHATLGGSTYFDDSRSDINLVVVAGLDVAVKLGSNVFVVPTFRVLVGPRGSRSPGDPLGAQTGTGAFTFRYGIGARVGF